MTASDRTIVHFRAIEAEVAKISDDEIEVTGRLLDRRPGGNPSWWRKRPDSMVHDMALTLRIRRPDLVITAASASMGAHPYTICPDTLPRVQALVGLSVSRGFTRAVNERLGRENGCAHLTALVQALGPVVRQGAGAAFRDENEIPRADEQLWWVNSCHAWRDDGPLMDRLRAGDADGLRAFASRETDPAE